MTDKLRKSLILGSIILGVAFFCLSILVNTDSFRDIDYQSMLGLQQHISRFFDIPFSIFTVLGSTEISLIILMLVFTGLIIKKKKLFLGIFLYFSIYLIELIGKLVIFHPSPPALFHRYALNIYFPSQFVVNTRFAFPSGHMARSIFLVIIALFLFLKNKNFRYRKIVAAGFFIFTLVMFISRVYLGEHWLSDVIGGLFLGSTIAFLSLSFW
ncbi:phosphatase PAP2 family protein [Candidatus Microgenomates bacterium]|nr:phosphatase PAP2 family protein [Candidatus Microgenomates bacterium]